MADEQKFNYEGTWTNQLRATMTIKVDGAGIVSGTFTSPAADGEDDPKPEPMVGFVRNRVIVFCNAFDSGSGTMLGQPLLPTEKDRFQTWWHFRPNVETDKVWASVSTGCDTFVRVR